MEARRRRPSHHHGWLIAILALGVLIRILRFPHVPPGLNQDEASSGYEAYCLMLTGRDRWGNPWPAYFPGWGSGQNVLYSYLSIPFVRAFGLTPLGIRAVGLLSGLACLPLVYLTVRRLQGRRTALVATALLALVPWHVMASRWGLESNLLPTFLLLGFYAFMAARRNPRLAPLAFVPWALAFYAYGLALLVVPSLALLLAVRYRRELLKSPGPWVAGLFVGLIVAFPFFAFVAKNYLHLGPPGNSTVLGFSVARLPSSRLDEVTGGLRSRIENNLGLIASGFDDGAIWNVARYAPIPTALLPFLLLALARPLRGLKNAPLALWLLASLPLFLAIKLDLNQANAALLPLLALSAVGVVRLWRGLKTPLRRPFALGVGAYWGVAAVLFAAYYFRPYRYLSQATFNEGLDGALAEARRIARPGEPILLSSSVPLPYVYVLVFDRADPASFQRRSPFPLDQWGRYVVPEVDGVYFDRGRIPASEGSFVFVGRTDESPGDKDAWKAVPKLGWHVARYPSADLKDSSGVANPW